MSKRFLFPVLQLSIAFAGGFEATELTETACQTAILVIGIIVLVGAVISLVQVIRAFRRGEEGSAVRGAVVFLVLLIFFTVINGISGGRLVTALEGICADLTLVGE
jgi:uncharacterized membrane protein YidH (DUF202 family)